MDLNANTVQTYILKGQNPRPKCSYKEICEFMSHDGRMLNLKLLNLKFHSFCLGDKAALKGGVLVGIGAQGGENSQDSISLLVLPFGLMNGSSTFHLMISQ